MPKGSRKASRPYPAISAIVAYDPSTRSWTRVTAWNTCAGSSSKPEIEDCSSFASTFTSSSVSELVLRWRRSLLNSSFVSSRVLVRLPLWTSTMP